MREAEKVGLNLSSLYNTVLVDSFMMQIKLFAGTITYEEEMEKDVNKFMARKDIDVVDVVIDMRLAPGDESTPYHGYSVIMVKYRPMDDRPIKEDEGLPCY